MAAAETKRLVTSEDVKNFLNLQEQLEEFRDKYQKYLKTAITRHGVEATVSNLIFPELTKSWSKQGNDEGILVANLQRFRVFHAAVRLVTKTADEKGQELSEKMELLLRDMTSVIWRVLRVNDVSVPLSPSSEDLEKNLNKPTKDFLCVVRSLDKENIRSDDTIDKDTTDSMEDRAVYDVRNYVILRDLGYMLLQFTRDLGHLIR